jgi:hypothetical protein
MSCAKSWIILEINDNFFEDSGIIYGILIKINFRMSSLVSVYFFHDFLHYDITF